MKFLLALQFIASVALEKVEILTFDKTETVDRFIPKEYLERWIPFFEPYFKITVEKNTAMSEDDKVWENWKLNLLETILKVWIK